MTLYIKVVAQWEQGGGGITFFSLFIIKPQFLQVPANFAA